MNNVPLGCKQTEVGVIPEDWGLKRVGDISTTVASGTSRVDSKFGDYPVYGSTGVIGQCVKGSYSGKAILIARVGANAGKLTVVDGEYGVTDNTIIVRIDESCILDYFWRQLEAKRLNSMIFGSGQPLITGTQIKSLSFPLPPTRAEQEAIAEALSDTDALIESLEQLITKKRHLKQGTMQELLTGQKRLPGFETKPGYKQTEVGVIPEDWEVMSLSSFCEIVAGRDLVKGDYSSTSDYSHQFPIYSNALTTRGLYGYSKYHQYEPNRITVTARGDIGHAVHRITRFCAIGRLLVLSSKRECDLRFVTEYINNFVEFALESTGVPQLTAPQISKYAVALPHTKAEQTAIATILSDMDAENAALEAKLSKARQLKQGMMQELLTGRIRLI